VAVALSAMFLDRRNGVGTSSPTTHTLLVADAVS